MKSKKVLRLIIRSLLIFPVAMYLTAVAFAFFSITNAKTAKANFASDAFNIVVVAPVVIGMHTGGAVWDWMFGEPKPQITGGGYGGQCPFLSDRKDPNGGVDCQNLGPTSPPWSTLTTGAPIPRPPFTNPHEPCGFYRRILGCMNGCSEVEKNRLIGYYQTCSGMTQLTMTPPPPPIYGLDESLVTACSLNQNYQNYVNKMRSCLQVATTLSLKKCVSCTELVDNIIHSHNPCNVNTGFCDMGDDPRALKCFGAALGASWQGFGGGHSILGPIRSVGICHMFIDQAMTCAASNTDFTNWWNNICTGYQQGCGGAGGSNCGISCPTSSEMGLATQYVFSQLLQILAQLVNDSTPGAIALAGSLCEQLIGN